MIGARLSQKANILFVRAIVPVFHLSETTLISSLFGQRPSLGSGPNASLEELRSNSQLFLRPKFRPQGIWASRLGFGPPGWDEGFEAGIWAWRLWGGTEKEEKEEEEK